MDFSLLDVTVSQDITSYQDRYATGAGGSIDLAISNSTAFQGFVELSRVGYAEYSFEANKYFGEDNLHRPSVDASRRCWGGATRMLIGGSLPLPSFGHICYYFLSHQQNRSS